ncbi:basic amino acid ABC transporter substrate-binding protein [Clostridia bacterium]|nr:basic amino acid ABC transporter substrate-binding protein [Clostridia bacterium]
MKTRVKILLRLIFVLMIGCVMGFSGCRNTSGKLTIEVFKKRGKLVVLTEPYFAPYEYYNKKAEVVGVDMDIAELIAKALGVKVEIRPQMFEGLFSALDVNEGDIVMAALTLTLTPGRGDHYLYSAPYADACQKILILEDRNDIKEFKDFSGKTVGVPAGFTSETCVQEAKEDGRLKGTEIRPFLDVQAVLRALENKCIDAALLDSRAADYYAQRDPERLKVLPELIGTEKYAFMYSKNMSQEVISLIDNIIARIKTDGTLDGFYAKHSPVNADGGGED